MKMECSLAYRACPEEGITQGVEIQYRDWELKNPSVAPHQERDHQVGPAMISLSLQSLRAPSGMPWSSQLPTPPSYSPTNSAEGNEGHQSLPLGRRSKYLPVSYISLPIPLWTLA